MRSGIVTILIVGILGFAAVGAGARYWSSRNSSAHAAMFHGTAEKEAYDLTSTLLQYGGLVSESRALFYPISDIPISRAQYGSYLHAAGLGTARYPGLLGVGLIQRVLPSELPAFLSSLRADGLPASVAPAGQRSEYCLGSYAAWSALHLDVPLFGYDFCTVPSFSKALQAATDSGEQQILEGSSLSASYRSDLVMIQPVYAGAPSSAAEGEREVGGWAVAIVDKSKLLRGIRPEPGVALAVFSGASATGAPVMQWPVSTPLAGSWAVTNTFDAYGPWTVEFRAISGAPQAGTGYFGPIVLLALGSLIVGLLLALLWSMLTARVRAFQQVDRATRSLRASEVRFRSLAGASPIAILEMSPRGVVNYASGKAEELSGRSSEELMGYGWLDAVHPDDRSQVLSLAERPRPDRSDVQASFRVVRPDGELRHVRLAAAPKGPDLESGYVVTVDDVTEELQAQERLLQHAFYDPLTGLPNRTLFLDRLKLELRGRARSGSNIAVLFADLDRFKLVNDSLGHDTGDFVLTEVGSRFAGAIRAGETAARFGGDEFLFIIKGVTCEQDAIAAAERIRSVLSAPISYQGRDLRVAASIGIVLPDASADAAAVLRDADAAMYRAKAAGRDRYQVFDEGLHEQSLARLDLESALRDALAEDQFEVYFHPILDPSDDRPVAAEALIRWRHPVRGMVPPLEFIPVAEESGLINPIGEWVFRKAVAQLALWDATPGCPRLEVLGINLSVRQFDDPGTAGMIRDTLKQYGVDPGRITLEITESELMGDAECIRSSLNSLKELGVRIGIDDFGTGYSSLSYLHALPVSTVKIDRSFVARLGTNDDSTPVLKAIVEMSHALDLRVIAEGVSTDFLRDAVADLGCDRAQGFYWTEPLPGSKFEDWWREAQLRSGASRVGAAH